MQLLKRDLTPFEELLFYIQDEDGSCFFAEASHHQPGRPDMP
jgi:hypothetical protein